MAHEELEKTIFALYDGELSDEQTAQAKAHLESCLQCRQTLSQWNHAAQALFKKTQPQASETFVASIVAKLEAQPSGIRSRFSFWPKLPVPRLTWAAAGLMALALALLRVSTNQTQTAAITDADMEYVAEMLSNANGVSLTSAETENEDAETLIEEYFL